MLSQLSNSFNRIPLKYKAIFWTNNGSDVVVAMVYLIMLQFYICMNGIMLFNWKRLKHSWCYATGKILFVIHNSHFLFFYQLTFPTLGKSGMRIC